jgi:hypothetical protein
VEGQALHALGEIALAKGDASAATTRLAEASTLFEDLGSLLWQAKTLSLLSEVRVASGDVMRANGDLDLAARLLRGVDSKEATRCLAQLETTKARCSAPTLSIAAWSSDEDPLT